MEHPVPSLRKAQRFQAPGDGVGVPLAPPCSRVPTLPPQLKDHSIFVFVSIIPFHSYLSSMCVHIHVENSSWSRYIFA